MKFFPRSVAALAAVALFPIAAMAQEPVPQGPPPQGGRGSVRGMAPRQPVAGRGQMPANRVMLTDQQREEIRAFDEQQRQTLETTRRDIGDLHRQLNEALTAEKLDTGKINSLRSSIVQKETAVAQARVDRLSKLSSILTAEQRQSLRGRGLGEIFGPGGAGGGRGRAISPQGGPGRPGMPGGRGGVIMRQRGPMGDRAMIQRRQGAQRQILQRRGPRGGGGGRVMVGPQGRGMIGGRGGALREPGSAGEVARLRAEIRRLEAQLELLRRRIR